MPDLAPFAGQHAFWIVAINTLLHELGVPLPMMPIVLIVGARAASGAIDPLPPIAAIVAATVVGNALWFAAGRRYGTGVLRLLCRFSLSADACVSRTQAALGRHGWSSLVVGRFVPGVSLVAPPLAGALGMSWTKFLILTTASAALYGLVVIGVGMLLADHIESALRHTEAFGREAAVAVGVALVLYTAWRWWRRLRVARMRNVPRMSVAELKTLIAAGKPLLVVDVRGAPMRKAEPRQIPGAIVIALDAIRAGRAELPRDRPIVLYCTCPNEASAAEAARLLFARGYTGARPLHGGLEAWIAAGHAGEATPTPAATSLTPRSTGPASTPA